MAACLAVGTLFYASSAFPQADSAVEPQPSVVAQNVAAEPAPASEPAPGSESAPEVAPQPPAEPDLPSVREQAAAPTPPPLPSASSSGESGILVRTELAPPVIPFHRQALFTITVDAPADAQVRLPDIVSAVGALEIAGPLDAPTRADLGEGRSRLAASYRLEGIWTGDYPLRPITVTVLRGESILGEATAPGPVLRIRDLTPEEEEAATRFAVNVAPTDPVDPLWTRWWFQAGMAAAAIAAVVLVTLWLRRRRGGPRPAPELPAWVTAYNRIHRLDARQWAQSGNYEPYYVELSSILRDYIEARFDLHAPEETTPEFLAEASRSGQFSDAQQQMLAAFLRHSDRVKFARYQPGRIEMEQSMADVLRFIDETVPREESELQKQGRAA